MPILVVLGLSLLVGGAVYLATVRTEQQEVSALGFGREAPAPGETETGGLPSPGAGYAYLRISTEGPSIRDRLQGFVGVLVLVGVAAAVMALAIYQAGHLINVVIESFLGS